MDACDVKTNGCVYEAKTAAACDDGNPCTKNDTCSAGGTCAGGANACIGCTSVKDCAPYDDGNACNGVLFCNTAKKQGVCEILPSSVVICDPSGDTACAHATCNPAVGACTLSASADGTQCDDDNPCTQGDTCAAGECTFAADVCQCGSTSDCAKWDDPNSCNGALYCDKTKAPYLCKVNPATKVVCPSSQDPCLVNACDAKEGSCAPKPAPDGLPCSDGDIKTVGDVCLAGKCTPGQNTASCTKNLDCLVKEDGDLCNGTMFCNLATSQCQVNPATVVSCPSANDSACQTNLCKKTTGLCAMTAASDGKLCDDGNVCTTGDVCKSGSCTSSADTCQCKVDGDCAKQEDGDACNGTLFCNQASHQCVLDPSTVVSCPDAQDTQCSANQCDKKTGKCGVVALKSGEACDDGNTCTVGEVCKAGACVASADTCSCKADSDCDKFDDENACNGTLFCDKSNGQCVVNPASVVVCPSAFDTACQHNQCQPKTGTCAQVPVNTGGQCDADGNPCTANDWCSEGVCKPGALVCNCQLDQDCKGLQGEDLCVGVMYCDLKIHECKPAKITTCDTSQDGACQVTTCDATTGKCATKARQDGQVCEGNTLCTGAQVCAKGVCITGKAVNCDDVNPCTADSCAAKQGGCVHLALDATACDDGSMCTSADVCAKGACVGTTVPCNDNEACTDDACDPKSGCVHLAVAATSCDDSDPCSVGDVCGDGVCQAGKGVLACGDGNPCTLDSCKTKVGCAHDAAALQGKGCDDGEICTTQDTCTGGACAGLSKDCDDNNPCTTASCTKGKGCVFVALQQGKCSDGDACTVGEGCKNGVCAGGSALACDDNEPCTVDSCDKAKGCVNTAKQDAETCSDKNPCTTKDSCKGGKCVGAAVNCDDGEVCTDDACDPDLGKCLNLPGTATTCEDNNVCTVGDLCKGGACKAGKTKPCDDANVCTNDACDPTKDCVHVGVVGTACDDGSVCTESDACAGATCTGKTKSCDDGNPCTTDSCDPKTGCIAAAKTGVACDDNNACTAKDGCAAGKCAGITVSCDDGNTCTADSCDTSSGCKKQLLDKVPCSDSDACTEDDTCDSGICKVKQALWTTVLKDVSKRAEEVNDAAVDSTGALVYVGARRIADSFDSDGWDLYVHRVNKDGETVYLKSESGSGNEKMLAVTPGLSGDVFTAGWKEKTSSIFSKNREFMVVRYNGAGSSIWSSVLGAAGTQECVDVVLVGTTAVIAAAKSGGSPYVLRYDATKGGMTWNLKLSKLDTDVITRVAAAGTTEFVAAGYSFSGKGAWVTRVNTNKSILWSETYAPPSGKSLRIAGVVAVGESFLLAGKTLSGSATYPLLMRIDAKGKLLWMNAMTYLSSGSYFTNLVTTPDGGALGTGVETAGGLSGLLVRFNSQAHVSLWGSVKVPNGASMLMGAGVRADGSVMVAGISNVSNIIDPTASRVDGFGNATCAASGSCMTTKVSQCEDNNPCTLDRCGAKTGCVSSNVPSGIICGVNKICFAGVCQ